MRQFALVLALLLHAVAAAGSDGVLEINHACAMTTGCFAGDNPGYPVQITQAGSYQLTSNLTVPANTNGLEVANGVDLDLGGFEIAGPVSCLLGCPAPSAGSGIVSALFGGNQCAVSNGKVRGFGEDGVRLGQQADVRRLRITDVARHGLSLSGGSFAAENLINRVGQNGIRFTVTSLIAQSLYRDNTIANTGQQSVVNGKASAANVCTDQLCGTSGSKLFYLSPSSATGAAAQNACEAGYHFASLWEIFDPSALEYDDARGATNSDSGQGPPARDELGFIPGWIRTGNRGHVNPPAGFANCDDWTSGSSTSDGSIGIYSPGWSGTPTNVMPWDTRTSPCDQPHRVWCIQD